MKRETPLFQGAATAIITPLNEKGIDYKQFERLITFQVDSGIDAIVVCGTTGESSTLTDAEHKKAEPYKPMTPEEIAASQEKLGINPTGGSTATPMTDEEIEESKKKINSEPEKVEEPKEPTKEEKKKGKKKKVTKRKRFDWKNNKIVTGVKKSYYVLKGIIFGENMYGRTKDYQSLSMAIGAYRSVYKTRDIATNNAELQGLDTKIASSTLLTIDEKKRLYVKLGKLAKQVEKNNRVQQAAAAKATHDVVEDLNEEVSFTR